MEQLLPTMPEALRERVAEASRYTTQIPAQLFLQALVTFDLMHRMIGYSALFFSQRNHTPWVASIGSLTEKTPKKLPIGRTGLDSTREVRWRACRAGLVAQVHEPGSGWHCRALAVRRRVGGMVLHALRRPVDRSGNGHQHVALPEVQRDTTGYPSPRMVDRTGFLRVVPAHDLSIPTA